MSKNIKNYQQYLGAQKCCDLKTTGAQGPQGSPGIQGPMGLTGARGPQGPAYGAQGDPGTPGERGPRGYLGPQGATGATGSQGATGSFSPLATIWGQALNWNDITDSWQITGDGPLAFGNYAGQTSQGTAAIAIGIEAGNYIQSTGAIAIGYQAGQINQGANSIAIGTNAGQTSQAANTIVLNASGVGVTGAIASAFYVNPIRNATYSNVLSYDLTTREVSYYAKSFIIEHPHDKDRYLVHACLEGPEGGIYYRGKGKITNNENVEIKLPDYVNNFGSEFTISVTPIYSGKKLQLYTSEVENNQFTVYSDNGNTDFYWIVYGKRCDIEIEPYKNKVNIKGNGPYRWI